MKQDTHPTYFPAATVTCSCGQSFTVGSTVETIHVEICSNCHPFYTGKQNLVDTAGRVDRFKQLLEKRTTMAAKKRRSPKTAAANQ